MSWDISVTTSETPPPPAAEMPDDWGWTSLGTSDEVRSKLSESLPGIDWSDPTWGVYDGDGYSFELNMGRRPQLESFMIHVRGGGDAVPALLEIGRRCGWYLLDCSAGEWFHHLDDPSSGWQGFQSYRDQVLGQPPHPEKNGACP